MPRPTAALILSLVTALPLAPLALGSQAEGTPPSSASETDPTAPRDTQHYNLPKNALAIEGYDPVAYFAEGGGKATKGDAKLTFEFRGVTYRFASAENLERFKKNPQRYEPAYGGWCASAMADGGRKVEINPKAFEIKDGRLFLFYKTIFEDARSFWDKNPAKNAADADQQWKSLTGEEKRDAPAK